MLNREDREAIEGLFHRLKDVERRAEPREPEAEALIRSELGRRPAAPYYMAQTILVQEHALSVAERRIKELEEDLERVRGSVPPATKPGPWDRQDRYGGGGFLAGEAQTALGVTGGVLIGSAIASMFGGGAATAAEAQPAPEPQPNKDIGDAGGDDADMGDFGDFGGFDFGGDF